jgi:CAAX protease family protein
LNSSGFFERRPLLASAIVVLALVGIGLALHVAFAALPAGPSRLLLSAGVMVPSLAIALLFGARLGLHRSGFRRRLDPTGRWSLALLALPLLAAMLVLSTRASALGPFLLTGGFAILIALHEESWFRGVILTALAIRGPTYGVVASAMLFGLAHSANLLTTSGPPAAIAFQVTTACMVGVVFGAVRLRTGMVWPTILAHALIDWAALLAIYPSTSPPVPTMPTVVGGLLIYGILAGIGIGLVRRAEPQLQAGLRLS